LLEFKVRLAKTLSKAEDEKEPPKERGEGEKMISPNLVVKGGASVLMEGVEVLFLSGLGGVRKSRKGYTTTMGRTRNFPKGSKKKPTLPNREFLRE